MLIGIRAHYIDVLEENGQLIVRHRRQYGDVRTDVSDYSTTLSVLSRNAGAWNNSGIRKELPDPLRDYLDGLEKPELKEKLRLMSGLNDEYGYRAAVDAMTMSLKNGDVNSSDATIIAQRITGYGIDTRSSRRSRLVTTASTWTFWPARMCIPSTRVRCRALL